MMWWVAMAYFLTWCHTVQVPRTLIKWMCVGLCPEARVPHRCRLHSCFWDRPTCVLQVATLETTDPQEGGKLVLGFWPDANKEAACLDLRIPLSMPLTGTLLSTLKCIARHSDNTGTA